VKQESEESYDEEEYDEEVEEQEEEKREPITHCIHRLPFKGMKVNLELFYDVVLVDKVRKV
jgi:hypothetical protein